MSSFIRELRMKQNREAEEYNKAINRQVLDKMHSQVSLWENERPSAKILELGTVEKYEENINNLISLLTDKTKIIDNIDATNKSTETQMRFITNNRDFLSVYNLLVRPLSVGGVEKKVKSAIENLIVPLEDQINRIVDSYDSLINNEQALSENNLYLVANAYALYKMVKSQFDKNVFTPITDRNFESYFQSFISSLEPVIINKIRTIIDNMGRSPALRKQAVEAQVGKMSPEEMQGVNRLEGVREFPALPTGEEEVELSFPEPPKTTPYSQYTKLNIGELGNVLSNRKRILASYRSNISTLENDISIIQQKPLPKDKKKKQPAIEKKAQQIEAKNTEIQNLEILIEQEEARISAIEKIIGEKRESMSGQRIMKQAPSATKGDVFKEEPLSASIPTPKPKALPRGLD